MVMEADAVDVDSAAVATHDSRKPNGTTETMEATRSVDEAQLEFMRNKTVLMIGDSVDRKWVLPLGDSTAK